MVALSKRPFMTTTERPYGWGGWTLCHRERERERERERVLRVRESEGRGGGEVSRNSNGPRLHQ